MIVEQTGDGFAEVDRPKGGRIRVEFRGEAAHHPDIEAAVVQLLSEGTDGNVYEAIAAYAKGFGLAATYFLGAEWMIIEIYQPLVPLVNASGGSLRSTATKHPAGTATPVLARSLRLRAPTG